MAFFIRVGVGHIFRNIQILGYKKDVWIAINPDTGVHRETVPPQTSDSCPVGHPETVFIGRTEYKIVMSDTKKPNRLWNATFVDYSSHLLPSKFKAICRIPWN
jgi:hypothetical protein